MPIDPARIAQVSKTKLCLRVIEWVHSLTDELRLLVSRNEVERFWTRAAAATVGARLVGSLTVRSHMPRVVPK
jgi:hypothetical protein